ncbi:hypothetical protein SISSUDRAFT_1059146 [Sistotremastrum suecicum HHB10207 ss-3]|uniref:HTH APSES-type domain-containing protein n=1 Tax=Sistotremastrum suecicum HHB10207 ss-3 TaxID=1314776 RepID=A0A166GMR3_9AGAM|nr:hypothetical protein SISSUDRAFT_1059146 [Sistotremastrum suecicum HHB10207 ss-3]
MGAKHEDVVTHIQADFPRPALPVEHANPLIRTMDYSKPPSVKYQVIEREGQEIIVGRVKVSTPGGGHAFLLRRFDTGAVSLTTMFRAAFPSAPDEAEKIETNWVKQTYDTAGANGTAQNGGPQRLRLAGTWLPPDVAAQLAESYAITKVLLPLAEATPDPSVGYRKHTKSTPNHSATNGQTASPPSSRRSPASPSAAPPTKRRKVSPAPAQSPPPAPAPMTTRARSRASKSPAPAQLTSANSSPTKPRSRGPTAPPTIPEEETLQLSSPDVEADIAASQGLVEAIKATYQDAKNGVKTPVKNLKRTAEEAADKFTFQPKEPETVERVIVAPRRLFRAPQRQAAAWGALAFTIGLGAA